MHKYDIILIADEPWEHFTWRRRHYIARAIAKNNRVLFIEPPLAVFYPIKHKHIKWAHVMNIGRLKCRGRNLYSYTPFKLFPASILIMNRIDLDEINKKFIFASLRKVAKKLKFTNPVLVVNYSGFQYDYYGLFGESITVADWYDKFTAPTWDNVPTEYTNCIKKKQDVILKNADIVFAVSRILCDDLKHFHKCVHYIPNGVDTEDFDKLNYHVIPEKIKDIKKPRIGFLGMLHYIVDFELLNFIAHSRPDWSIVLIGKLNIKVESDKKLFKDLLENKNVCYLGIIEKAGIPAYLDALDVCIAPMKKIEMNKYADPLKLWEYLASGRPIVAVDQGAEYECDGYIKKADTKEGFVLAIEEAMREADSSLIAERKEFARANSWSSRADEMVRIISEFKDTNR